VYPLLRTGGLRVRSPFRRKNFGVRVLAPVAAAVAAVCAASPTPSTLALGVALGAGGEALRLWATGYLLKTDELTTAGPYAHLRHPLYAGTLLVGLGVLTAAGPRVLAIGAPLGLGFFFLYYLPRKERIESERLHARYGAAFDLYRKSVRALVPRLRPFEGRDPDARWSFARVVDNDELGTALAVTVAFAALAARLAFLR
jgi:protein-S-isoprenylcysteine O-methyltransferase Ste14